MPPDVHCSECQVKESSFYPLMSCASTKLVPSAALVVVNIRINSSDGVAFLSSSYNFSLKENQNPGVTVGQVLASAGSDLYEVSYELRTHKDLFSINGSGTIFTTKQLDREEQEWYILEVEAVDTRTPPTSAVALVTTSSHIYHHKLSSLLLSYQQNGLSASLRSEFRWRT